VFNCVGAVMRAPQAISLHVGNFTLLHCKESFIDQRKHSLQGNKAVFVVSSNVGWQLGSY